MSWRERCGAGEQPQHIARRAPPDGAADRTTEGPKLRFSRFTPWGSHAAAARPSKQASDSAFPSSRKEQVLHFNRQFFFKSEKDCLYVTNVLNLIFEQLKRFAKINGTGFVECVGKAQQLTPMSKPLSLIQTQTSEQGGAGR